MTQQWDIPIRVASSLALLVTMTRYLWIRLEDGPQCRQAGSTLASAGHRQAQSCFLLFPLEDRVSPGHMCVHHAQTHSISRTFKEQDRQCLGSSCPVPGLRVLL